MSSSQPRDVFSAIRTCIANCTQYMAVFQEKGIIFQGQFSIISAFSIENSETKWPLFVQFAVNASSVPDIAADRVVVATHPHCVNQICFVPRPHPR